MLHTATSGKTPPPLSSTCWSGSSGCFLNEALRSGGGRLYTVSDLAPTPKLPYIYPELLRA